MANQPLVTPEEPNGAISTNTSEEKCTNTSEEKCTNPGEKNRTNPGEEKHVTLYKVPYGCISPGRLNRLLRSLFPAGGYTVSIQQDIYKIRVPRLLPQFERWRSYSASPYGRPASVI
ncbi:hypothetical protein B0I37DRAFT_68252 [Chaetomium sp. MPI-CAGE-AT-0009]|nr:hypothetical protein B0I37DRAFT_68252 [Chaetomium sp. MPI-CAGE-AT-0009]